MKMSTCKIQMKKWLLAMILICGGVIFSQISVHAATETVVTDIVQQGNGKKSAKLGWNSNSTGNGTYYFYRWSEESTFLPEATTIKKFTEWDGKDTPYGTVRGLSAGHSYYVQIGKTRTDDASTIKAWSKSVQVVTAPADTDEWLLHLTATETTATTVTLKWDAASGANYYDVYYFAEEDPIETVRTSKTSIKLSSLKKNANYTICLYAGRKSESGYLARSSRPHATATSDDEIWHVKTLKSDPVKTETETTDGSTSDSVTLAKVTGVKCTSFRADKTKGYTTFSVKKVLKATGYEYRIYNQKNKRIASGKTTNYKKIVVNDKDLISRAFFKIRIRAYSANGTKVTNGAWSSYVYFAKLNTTDVKAAKSGGKMKISWKKVTGATEYSIYRSTKKSSDYKKIGTTKKLSVLTKYTKGKTYYIRVIPTTKVKDTSFKAVCNSKSSYSKKVKLTK